MGLKTVTIRRVNFINSNYMYIVINDLPGNVQYELFASINNIINPFKKVTETMLCKFISRFFHSGCFSYSNKLRIVFLMGYSEIQKISIDMSRITITEQQIETIKTTCEDVSPYMLYKEEDIQNQINYLKRVGVKIIKDRS